MVFQIARKLKATVLGADASDPSALRELASAGVPVTDSPCRSCGDPCDEGHEDFSKRFDVDMETEMRGSVKPYRRQVLISTGKADWAREVTDVDGTLAKFLSDANSRLESSHKKGKDKGRRGSTSSKDKLASPPTSPQAEGSGSISTGTVALPTGVFAAAPHQRLSVLNGSHHSLADDADTHATALVLPDYVAVPAVPVNEKGAAVLWRLACDPDVGRAGTRLALADATSEAGELKTWPLPYNCVILLCSHKKRDARCHIAAQRLEVDFTHTLTSAGWSVDTDLSHDLTSDPPLEARGVTETEREAAARAALQALNDASEKRALVLKNSHIGGHKYAGNVIIYFPQGSSVWYGRVTPHEVNTIVQETIIGGKVLPPLLRGGLNISRPGCSSLLDW